MHANIDVPVIAIDGPSASGKGTIASRVAAKLDFHYLESGALYRLVALASCRAGVDENDEDAFALTGNTVAVRVGLRRESLARYYIRSQPAIDNLLELLISLRESVTLGSGLGQSP